MNNQKKDFTPHITDVICQHKDSGDIIPLKIRIKDEDGVNQIYMIKAFKDVSNVKGYTLPNGIPVTKNMRHYICKISILNREIKIGLTYNMYSGLWFINI